VGEQFPLDTLKPKLTAIRISGFTQTITEQQHLPTGWDDHRLHSQFHFFEETQRLTFPMLTSIPSPRVSKTMGGR
jgi:hypothetical protein